MSPTEAKNIIDCLADGIDPETGEIMSAESVFNNPQVIRALFIAGQALDRMAKREERKTSPPGNAGMPWSIEEEQELIIGFDDGTSVKELASKHGRTEGAIISRLFRLGRIKDRIAP
jgi:hypothetical protein